jgi:iron(III) transport system substrate-binding protein
MMMAVLGWLLIAGGCDRSSPEAPDSKAADEVVLYASLDEPYLRPLADRFQKQTGITVHVITDTEATKSAGLAEKIAAERDHPHADVYWGNEIFHSINLAQQGLLASYRPGTAADIPARWRDPQDRYAGTGLRARMIVISTRPQFKEIVAKVHGSSDLTDPLLKGKIGLSYPAFGTASGYFAALDVAWGEQRYEQWLHGLKANEVLLLGGNSVVADQVGAGTIAAGVTDNDDIYNTQSNGDPVQAIVPDQSPGGIGTLLIPCAISLVKNAPHPEQGKRLIDFLCRAEVEKQLLDEHFLAYSVRGQIPVKAMDVDYIKVAQQMPHAVRKALEILQGRRP